MMPPLTTLTLMLGFLGLGDTDRESVDFFEKKVRPVLVKHCYKCHSARANEPKGQLRLDTRAGIRKGGESGPAVVPGKVGESLLIEAIRHQSLEMPPDRKLPENVIADIVKWVEMGAPDPRLEGDVSSDSTKPAHRPLWSLQPVRRPKPPGGSRLSWPDHPVDRFILAKLEQAGLESAPPADRYALIRRLSFVLTGLPPTPDEIRTFAQDTSLDAYEKLVDRLLASPHFGERWARHWLDIVRFSETHGHEWNFEVRDAWRYRDYLIRAFNQDLPYDQLIREHIAGDLLPEPRWNKQEQFNESLIGTAFFRFGEAGHDDCLEFKEISLDVLDNQIDTLAKAFQGLTVACARCHDHKFDPISTIDYYALSGILSSSRQVARTLDAPVVNEYLKSQLRDLKSQIRQQLAALWLEDVKDAGRDLQAAQQKRNKTPLGEQLAGGLDEKRVSHWQAALDKLDTEKPGLEHPLYPWQRLSSRTGSNRDQFLTAWQELTARYEKESRDRAQFNAENFVPFGDFSLGGSSRSRRTLAGAGSLQAANHHANAGGAVSSWHSEGLGLVDAHCRSGDFSPACDGDHVLHSVFPEGLFTHKLSNRLNGALRSPFLPKDKKFLSVLVIGDGDSAVRTIHDNCHLGVLMENLKWGEAKWVKQPTFHEYPNSRVYVAIVTRFDNQFYPKYNTPKRIDPNNIRSQFGVTRAVLHDCDESPKDELVHMQRLFAGGAVESSDQLADRYANAIGRAVAAWAADKAADDDVRWINWLLKNRLLRSSAGATPDLKRLVEQYRLIERQIPPPKLINALADLDAGFNVRLKERGDPHVLGDVVPRRYLEVLAGSNQGLTTEGSGRRELADLIASPENPLTARVMVNRIWHHLFGTGIVRTTDDFGNMGEPPSHPELLDYLAARFPEPATGSSSNGGLPGGFGWSIKKMIRWLVLTESFRMSSRSRSETLEVDPENRLLHHYPLRRLEAEAIRDSILAVSGRLDRRLFGRSIHPYRFKERLDRRLFCGPLDGDGRRSIYTKVTLTEEPPFLAAFNFPEPKITRGRRDVTNVPAQALTLLNDPFVNQQAAVWATNVIAEESSSIPARIESMFTKALGRPPDGPAIERIQQLVNRLASLHNVPPDDVLGNKTVWKDVAHALFNLKEFIYTR